jgi:CRP-like cAMP-binding protein
MNIDSKVSNQRIFQVFRGFPIFRGIPLECLLVFYVAAREHIYRKGEVIVHEGDRGEELFILGGGSVRVIKNFGLPGEAELAVLGQGEFFGEMCVIEPIVRSATVIAAESCIAYALKSSSLNKAYQIWPATQTLIMSNLAHQLACRLAATDPLYRLHAH